MTLDFYIVYVGTILPISVDKHLDSHKIRLFNEIYAIIHYVIDLFEGFQYIYKAIMYVSYFYV